MNKLLSSACWVWCWMQDGQSPCVFVAHNLGELTNTLWLWAVISAMQEKTVWKGDYEAGPGWLSSKSLEWSLYFLGPTFHCLGFPSSFWGCFSFKRELFHAIFDISNPWVGPRRQLQGQRETPEWQVRLQRGPSLSWFLEPLGLQHMMPTLLAGVVLNCE